jgi:hypothetical protein
VGKNIATNNADNTNKTNNEAKLPTGSRKMEPHKACQRGENAGSQSASIAFV